MVGALEKLRRALVSLVLSLARAYNCTVHVTRESTDKEVESAYRQLSRHVHPDKRGGSTRDQTRLNEVHEAWQRGRKKAPGRGGNRMPSEQVVPRESLPATRAEYRIQSVAVLLTYQSFKDVTLWGKFLAFVRGNLAKWKVKYWCATLESNAGEGCHAHLMLQFTSCRDVASFAALGRYFRMWCSRNLDARRQESIHR